VAGQDEQERRDRWKALGVRTDVRSGQGATGRPGAPGRRMQATVRGFDPASGSGSVLFDDGSVAEFGPEAFAASGLRLLRRGQRVAVRCGPSGAVTALALATLPLPPEPAAGPQT
jgi:hypothetical protein